MTDVKTEQQRRMRYYPVNLDIVGRRCVVVGGGRVGARKVKTLLACGADVLVVSPEVVAAIDDLAREGAIELQRRAYDAADQAGAFLVIGATNDEALNRRIHSDAEADQRLCNIADRPAVCNFILPSIISRGDLTIAISTAGKSPAFAKHLRHTLEDQFGPEYAVMLDLMGAIRRRLLAQDHAPEAHKPLFEQLINSGLLDLIRAGNNTGIDTLLESVLGSGFAWADLIEPPGTTEEQDANR